MEAIPYGVIFIFTMEHCAIILIVTLFGAVYFGTQLEGGSVVLAVAKGLISDGLECKLLSIFEDLLSSNYPEQMVCNM